MASTNREILFRLILSGIVIISIISLFAYVWYWSTYIRNQDIKGQLTQIAFMQAPAAFPFNNATCIYFDNSAFGYCFKTQNSSFVSNFKNTTYLSSNTVCEYKAVGINFVSLKCD